jgi:hypothetical protein
MKKITKNALLISAALMVWAEGSYHILAAENRLPRGGNVPRGGSGLPQRGGPVRPMVSPITEQCDQCVSDIEILVKQQVSNLKIEETFKGEPDENKRMTQDVLVSTMQTVKDQILEHISELLEEEFKYLDQPVPDESKVKEIVKIACDKLKDTATIIKLIKEAQVEVQKPSSGTKAPQIKPRGTQQGGADENPFQITLKKGVAVKKEVNLSENEQFESTLLDMAKDSSKNPEVIKAERLQKIKDFLALKKTVGFTKGFTDEELLAFPVYVLLLLDSGSALNLNDGYPTRDHGNRKFSTAVLERLYNKRFHTDSSVRSDFLKLEKSDFENSITVESFLKKLGFTQMAIANLNNTGDLTHH